jgi:plasmid stabilization system protein ParE
VTKKYRVEVSESAYADLRSIKAHIAADNPRAADRWLAGVERLIAALGTFPFAFEIIPEAKELSVDYRQKLFGSYRIIYVVKENRVIIMRVIHAARLLDPSMFAG